MENPHEDTRTPNEVTFPLDDGDAIVRVETGANYGMAISANGDLFAWGTNDNGQLGTGDKENRTTPVKILSGVKYAFASDTRHSLAIGVNGEAWTWGAGSYGELGNGSTEDVLTPQRVGFKETQAPTIEIVNENGEPAEGKFSKVTGTNDSWSVSMRSLETGKHTVLVDGEEYGTFNVYNWNIDVTVSPDKINKGEEYAVVVDVEDYDDLLSQKEATGTTGDIVATITYDNKSETAIVENGKATFTNPFGLSWEGDPVTIVAAISSQGQPLARLANTANTEIEFTTKVVSTEAPTIEKSQKCGVEATVVIPDVEGVVYEKTVNGSNVSIVARPETGYALSEDSVSTWEFDVSAKKCEEASQSGDSTEKPANSLVKTGANAASLIIGAIILVALGTGAVLVRRKRS